MLLIAVCEMWEIRPLNYKSIPFGHYKSIPFGQAHLFLHKVPDPKQEMTSHQLVIFQLNRHFLLNLFFDFFFLPSIPAKTLIPPPSLSFSLPPSPSLSSVCAVLTGTLESLQMLLVSHAGYLLSHCRHMAFISYLSFQ